MAGFIRRADENDVPRLLELEQVFENSMTDKMIERELAAGFGWVYVRAGRPIGYALVRQDRDLYDLTRLAVDPAEEGTGAGSELLRHVLALGRDVMLITKKTNARALRLYLKHGFRVVGHFPGEDAWALRRDAAPSERRATE